MDRYESAKEIYAKYGIDTEEAINKLDKINISMHCWQGDDVTGFDHEGPLTGGIQATGNYPGKAMTPEELMEDMDLAFSLIPGKHKINLHACYAIFEDGSFADRDKLKPEHFKKWVEYAKKRGIGIDFNPTFFSHPMVKEGLTLSSPDCDVRRFWINHGKACIKISEYFAEETGYPCVMNIWIPDGYKDIPADRLGPRKRFMDSLDEILSVEYDKSKVYIALESKVFGIGLESYTVGSSEFTMNYAATRGILSLMDNGHYHPTEVVSDKISAMLLFSDKLALHVTRPVRWDSDHVVLFDDETREIAKEIIRNDALDKVFIALDYFDASINRVAAWVTGMRNMQKSLLFAMLQPYKYLKECQDNGNFTELIVLQEEIKCLPFSDVWNEFCNRNNVPEEGKWLNIIKGKERK